MGLHKLSELEDIIRDATLIALDISKSNSDSKVRISYPSYNDSGDMPGPNHNEDVIYVSVFTKDSHMNRLRDTTRKYSTNVLVSETIQLTRVLEFKWVAYGRSSFDSMEQLFIELLTEKVRRFLKDNNISIVPDFTTPYRVPEYFNGMWWERCDFNVEAYEYIEYITTVPTIEDAGDGIHLTTEKGEVEIHVDTTN